MRYLETKWCTMPSVLGSLASLGISKHANDHSSTRKGWASNWNLEHPEKYKHFYLCFWVRFSIPIYGSQHHDEWGIVVDVYHFLFTWMITSYWGFTLYKKTRTCLFRITGLFIYIINLWVIYAVRGKVVVFIHRYFVLNKEGNDKQLLGEMIQEKDYLIKRFNSFLLYQCEAFFNSFFAFIAIKTMRNMNRVCKCIQKNFAFIYTHKGEHNSIFYLV